MKKKTLLIVLCILIVTTTTSCAKLQTALATEMLNAYGETVPENLEEEYQAQWDQLFNGLREVPDSISSDIKERAAEEARKREETQKQAEKEKAAEEAAMCDAMVASKTTPGHIKNDDGSFSEEYGDKNKFSPGQCTWYSYGRFLELTDIELPCNGNAGQWDSECQNSSVVEVTSEISAPAVAVTNGHVIIIENVTYNEDGTPDKVYFSECNWETETDPGRGVYNEGKDCIMKEISYSDYISSSGRAPKAYIVPKNR